MYRWSSFILWLVMAFSGTGLLSACGQKGPLYMPDPAEQQEQAKQQDKEK